MWEKQIEKGSCSEVDISWIWKYRTHVEGRVNNPKDQEEMTGLSGSDKT